MPKKTITFKASIPPIGSALRGGGDGMRVLLEIPESDMDQGLWLFNMRNEVLDVSITGGAKGSVPNECPEKPKRDTGDKEPTLSQRLRMLIWDRYVASDQFQPFEDYYHERMLAHMEMERKGVFG